MRFLRRALFAVAALVALVLVGVALIVRMQGGIRADEIPAVVSFDADGIPTITADAWNDLAEAQGYVVASERFFQMDLMRRAAAGRLSEWFGAPATRMDELRRREGWPRLAKDGYDDLSPEERAWVDAYARGVNRFLASHPYRVGLEYLLLRVEPEPWAGADTMLVLLSMLDQLTRSAEAEAWASKWRQNLPPSWADFLLTDEHPWNRPMFGSPPDAPDFPPSLPMEPLGPLDLKTTSLDVSTSGELAALFDLDAVGSNSWAYCRGGHCLLANDPHLGLSVPSLWYGLRLRRQGVSADEVSWVSGVTIPGLPGVTLGMNSHVAWAFTNVGEDVDDWLAEELSPDGRQYRVSESSWEPIRVETEVIKVRGEPDRVLETRFTRRGPIIGPDSPLRAPGQPFAALGSTGTFSRQWLGSRRGMLHFPVRLNRSRTIEEMFDALDGMTMPAQNVLIADRQGNLAYRASGTTVQRNVTGRVIQTGIVGEWPGVLPASSRPRMIVPTSTSGTYLATANERIFVDAYGHKFADDARKDRIRTVLATCGFDASPGLRLTDPSPARGARDCDFRVEDMERLQRDTYSRFHALLVAWVGRKARLPPELMGWDGTIASNPAAFARARSMEIELHRIVEARVRRHVLAPETMEWPFPVRLPRAWLLRVLDSDAGLGLFGLDEAEVANRLASIPADTTDFAWNNRWQAQHPFVGRAPIIGDAYRVPEVPQVGFDNVVRVERPRFGASVRLVWSPTRPEESRWTLPVGQSGHLASPHFRDLHQDWFAGKSRSVLP